MRTRHNNGFGLVEVLVGAAVLVVFIVSLVGLFQTFLAQSYASLNNVQASLLAEEGVEAVRFIRDTGYDDHLMPLADGQERYLVYDDGTWKATTTKQTYFSNDLKPTFTVEDVSRDGNDDIVQSGGTNDPGTKKVTVTVAWSGQSGTTTKSLTTYFANIHDE